MSMQNFLSEMKEIQQALLELIGSSSEEEDNFKNLMKLLTSQKFLEDPHKLKTLLWLLNYISLNHYCTPDFYNKIDKIIIQYQEEIKNHFSQREIFDIFKKNRRFLLFLHELQLISFDEHNICKINKRYLNSNSSYYYYFYPELKKVLDSDKLKRNICIQKDYEVYMKTTNYDHEGRGFDTHYQEYGLNLNQEDLDTVNGRINQIEKEQPDVFVKKRLLGKNDSHICKLIQNDSIDEFVQYISQSNISLKSAIDTSIYETNPLLLEKSPTLLEYAAFYGSLQIFNFLRMHDVDLSPTLWIYAIHGNNASMIHVLEEMKIKPKDNDFENCLKESIKCHHNEIANYIITNYINDDINKKILKYALKYFNFDFIDDQDIENNEKNETFYRLCQYDYYLLADFLLKNSDVNINTSHVFLF